MPILRPAVRPLQAIIEVERKFMPTGPLIKALASPHISTFQSISPQGSKRFEDVYYDTPRSTLSNKGIWLRRRVGVWEAKVGMNETTKSPKVDYTDAKYREYVGIEACSLLLKVHIPEARLCTFGAIGLHELARFTTFRESWILNNRFKVCVDRTDFDHEVGEVELTADAPELPEEAQKMSVEMDAEIERFMSEHRFAFLVGVKPVGKLSAYFKWKDMQDQQRATGTEKRAL